MSAAELKKVGQGTPFKPQAADWNAFVDAALANRGISADRKSGAISVSNNSDNGIILVQNDSGADLDQFAVVSLDSILITPTDNEDYFRHHTPVFSGKAVASGNISKPFAILQEPLKTGFLGQAMAAGVTPVKIAVSDASHAFAELAATGLQSAASGIVRILWKESGTGSKWAVIHFPAGGGGNGETAVICKITGNSNAPEYSVEIYANGKYSPATGTGTLYVLDISYCERLLVGTWVIGHQSNMSATSAG